MNISASPCTDELVEFLDDERSMPSAASAERWKVLVVDDEAQIRDILGFYLKRAGYQVLLAENGQQALDELAWLLSATPRTGKEIAVAAFDLDGFAETNAVRGREVGDLVLQAVAERVLAAVRSGDLVGRLEGDQFIVVLRGVHHLRGAIRVANKLRAAVEDPIPVPGGDVVQTISVGVTLVSLGEDVDGVLTSDAYAEQVRADEQLAARLGISGVPFFVIDGQYGLSGAQPTAQLVAALDQAWATGH